MTGLPHYMTEPVPMPEVYAASIDDGMVQAAQESGLLPAYGFQIDHLPQCDARRDVVAQWLASAGFSIEEPSE